MSSARTPIPSTALLARRQPIDMSLPGEQEGLRIHELYNRNKWRRYRRVTARAFALSLVLILTLGGLIVSQKYLQLHQVFRGEAGNAAALNPNNNPNLLKGQSNGEINILIMGRIGGKGQNADVTDSMTLASIDSLNHSVNLVTIPENLWVTIDGGGVGKIDTAFENGEFQALGKKQPGSISTSVIDKGFSTVDSSVSAVLGVPVDYNMLVNYQAFEQIVDTLGGVSVNVPSTLTDPTIAWQNANNPVIVGSGQQTLSGPQALLYVRSLETTSQDSRSIRQRQVLEAIVDKFLSVNTLLNPVKINAILDSFSNNVVTDLSINNGVRLAGILRYINPNNIYSDDFDTPSNMLLTPGHEVGQAILLPTPGLFNYGAIHKYIASQLGNPFLKEDNAAIQVLNGTNVTGLATKLSSTLTDHGFNVLVPADTPTAGWKHTVLIQLNANDKYTDILLERELKVKSTTKLPNGIIPTNNADFVIIIGNDETNNS
ncbi:MAG TPA: LCP family protein [Candidatus Sulfotelmatobacter sp.]|nr:LCP family protein [Candidatus Sulfotelmatobacter sp.]